LPRLRLEHVQERLGERGPVLTSERDELAHQRIYAGQHFRYDEDAGQGLGGQVGDFVSDSILGPADHPRPFDVLLPTRHRAHGRRLRAAA
jgi:hypothetical protein